MSSKGSTKLKLLYIKEYLEKHSDEQNPVSTDELLSMLSKNGINCERKSIYSDIQALRDYGMEILIVKKPVSGYCLVGREFEDAQLRLLIDAVQSASFISERKTKELIKKITTLCSEKRGRQLVKQVYIENRVKCDNEEIYYSIDVLNRAIEENKKVSFVYGKRIVVEGTKSIKNEGRRFVVSPYAMIWDNDHYYLVSNNQKYDNLMHTRIDRIRKVEMLEERSRHFSEVSQYRSFFDIADYSSKLFNMFSGELMQLEFVCENSILEEILDRFGSGAFITKCLDDAHFRMRGKASVSEGLVSWIMQFGKKLTVVEPESLRQAVAERAKEIAKIYDFG